MEQAQACLTRANKLLHAREWRTALEQYDEAAELFPKVSKNVGFHVQRGSALLGLGTLDEALSSFDNALALDADSATAWFKRGSACKQLRRYGDAAEAFRRATKLKPDLDAAHVSLVRMRLIQQQFEEAFAEGQAALDRPCEPPMVLHRLFMYTCVQLGRETHAEASALAFATRLCETRATGEPDPPELDEHGHSLLVRTLVKVAASRDDVRCWELACVFEPSFEHVLGLGSAHVAHGDASKARRCLGVAREMNPRDWRTYHHLGLLEFSLGAFRASAGLFAYALELFSKTPPSTPAAGAAPTTSYLDSVLEQEGRGRMMSRIQLHLGTALLNGGDANGARHHASSAAHSLGAARNLARVLLAGLLLRLGNLESAANTLNLARRELGERQQSRQQRGQQPQGPAAASGGAGGLGDKSETLMPRLHMDAARLLRLVCENEVDEKTEDQLRKLLEHERACYADVLQLDPGHEAARCGLESSSDRTKALFQLRKAAQGGAREAAQPAAPGGAPPQKGIRTYATEGSALRQSEGKAEREAEQARKHATFVASLQARRAHLEHDFAEHEEHSGSDDGDSEAADLAAPAAAAAAERAASAADEEENGAL